MTQDQFIEDFEAFARSKPADEAYDGASPSTCALAQFGLPNADIDTVPEAAFYAAVFRHSTALKPKDWSTFGALADRLAALRVEKAS